LHHLVQSKPSIAARAPNAATRRSARAGNAPTAFAAVSAPVYSIPVPGAVKAEEILIIDLTERYALSISSTEVAPGVGAKQAKRS
jgi:hypothetical protein